MRSSWAAFIALSCVLAGCGGGSAPATDAARTVRGDGVRYLLPAGWHAASHSLTPHLTNPRELLSAGTGPLPSTGGGCAQMPSAALHAMGPRDVLVTVQERLGSPAAFAPRPAHFVASGDTRSEAQACAGRRPPFRSYWFGFRDNGRGFHVLVAAGSDASRASVRRAFALLDSLRVAPRRPVRIDGDDALPFDDVNRGLHLVHPSAWRVYPGALTQAVSARNQLALGTFKLRQRRPDPDCSPVTAQRARRASDGFVFLFEYDGLNARQLARFPARPNRLRLPRGSLGNYECLGTSWLVRFRDGGRAFQAHVYGPPRRRREALAILDSLRVRPLAFDSAIHAARFPAAAGWRTRVSGPAHEGSCLRRRVSWASTVPFDDPPQQLPPHDMVASMAPDDVVIAAVQYTQCRRALPGSTALRPPLRLGAARRSRFPGSRGDELAPYRLAGRFAGRYYLDVWVFYGRPRPTAAQRRAAQRELSGVRWPAALQPG
jgi:hypothetical protein